MPLIEVAPEYFSLQLPKVGRFTPEHEVCLLGTLVNRAKGNVLELGCNEGHTTRDLATNFPDRRFYAVDCTADRLQVDPYQQVERVTTARLAVHARHLPNVSVIDCDTKELNYFKLKDIGLVFIDADHTYAGVKWDTAKALQYFECIAGGIIVWHDFFKDQPDHWVKVSQYIYAELVPRYDIYLYAGTTVAYMEIKH